MKNNWKPETFSPTQIKANLDNKIFTVPLFQRGLVWKDKQRSDLIDSIKKGLPFGSLLLYEDTIVHGKQTYQIIDGLQRSNALSGFVSNPSQFFDENDIDIGAIRNIVAIMGTGGNISTQEELVKSKLIEWVKTHKDFDSISHMQFPKFGQLLASEFPTCKDHEFEIGDIVQPMLTEFQKTCSDINNIEIPAIIVTGSNDMLPILFERINSKGTDLTKYQIFAATWSGNKFTIDDSDLIDIVYANRDRYDNLLDGTGQLVDYDSVTFINDKVLDPFEIAFGFGKKLCKDFPHLFGSSKEVTDVEGIGFTLINACLCQKNKDIPKLHTALNDRIGQNDICMFLKKIIEATRTVDNAIGKYSKFKSNSRKDSGKHPLHGEFHIASIIASVFLSKHATVQLDADENIIDVKFDFVQNNIKWNQQLKNSFSKNVGKRYIIDIVQHKWSNAGDRKLDAIITSPDFYARDVSVEEFEGALDVWFETLNSERSEKTRVTAAKDPELLFLSALYLPLFSAQMTLDGSNYDIEHLATQNMMKKRLADFDPELRLPISSIGNICLLPECANRSKKDKTIYEDTNYLSKAGITLADVEQKYSFTKAGELDWLSDASLSREQFETAYRKFIKDRFLRMKAKMVTNYSKL